MPRDTHQSSHTDSTTGTCKPDPSIYVHYTVDPNNEEFPFQVELFTELTQEEILNLGEEEVARIVSTKEAQYYFKDQKIFRDREDPAWHVDQPTQMFVTRVQELIKASPTLQLMTREEYDEFTKPFKLFSQSFTKYRPLTIDDMEQLEATVSNATLDKYIELSPWRPRQPFDA